MLVKKIFLCLIFLSIFFQPILAEDSFSAEGSPPAEGSSLAEDSSLAKDSSLAEGSSTSLSKVNNLAFSILFFDLSFGTIEVNEVTQSGEPILDDSGLIKKKKSLFLSLFCF